MGCRKTKRLIVVVEMSCFLWVFFLKSSPYFIFCFFLTSCPPPTGNQTSWRTWHRGLSLLSCCSGARWKPTPTRLRNSWRKRSALQSNRRLFTSVSFSFWPLNNIYISIFWSGTEPFNFFCFYAKQKATCEVILINFARRPVVALLSNLFAFIRKFWNSSKIIFF